MHYVRIALRQLADSPGFPIVAVLTCLIPARRATRVDPIVALRRE